MWARSPRGARAVAIAAMCHTCYDSCHRTALAFVKGSQRAPSRRSVSGLLRLHSHTGRGPHPPLAYLVSAQARQMTRRVSAFELSVEGVWCGGAEQGTTG